jgi:hypothetical protein
MEPETEKLFALLSACGWEDKKPEMNSIRKKMMEDKGMVQALKMVQSEMRQWEGAITGNGLIQFKLGELVRRQPTVLNWSIQKQLEPKI